MHNPHLPAFIDKIPGGVGGAGGMLAGALVVLAVLANHGKTPGERAEFDRSIERFVGNAAAVVGRYVSGRELDGVQRSAATWWRSGVSSPDDEGSETPLSELGRPRAASPKVSDSASAPGPVLRAVRAVVAPLVLLGRSLAGMWRVLRAWNRWPLAARSAVRLSPLPVAWGLWRSPGPTQAMLLASAVAVLVAALTGPAGLAWWRITPRRKEAGQVYRPGLWEPIRQILRLEESEHSTRWLEVPDDIHAEGARIMLRLPVKWAGGPEARTAIERIIDERAPGEWIARWERTAREHYVEWTPRPKPKPRVKLPDYVPWKPTGDPRKVFIGLAIEDNEIVEVFIHTKTDTPHWGVAGDTGAGKSTVLYIPVVNARQNGEVVDILDTKRNSLIEAEGYSGVRVHKTVRECMGAFAEFLASMMAAEAAREKGADPQLQRMLVGRTLVVDELPTLIKLAYIWWRHGLKGKGQPPFLDWLAIILLQGRSSDHRVVVGTQQFANTFFGGTMERGQIGTRVVVGQQERTSWGVAFGQSTPVVSFDTSVKGRGAFSDKRYDPEGEHLLVREIQACYITPDVGRYLAECPPAPGWFDRGELAPWITDGSLKEAAATAAIADFLPGGKFGPQSLPTAAVRSARALADEPAASQDTAPVDATGPAPADAPRPAAEPQADPDAGPAVYTLTEAFAAEILPWKAATVRTYRKRGEDRGIPFPEGVSDGHTWYYTEEELRTWLTAWKDWQKQNNANQVQRPRPAIDDAERPTGM